MRRGKRGSSAGVAARGGHGRQIFFSFFRKRQRVLKYAGGGSGWRWSTGSSYIKGCLLTGFILLFRKYFPGK